MLSVTHIINVTLTDQSTKSTPTCSYFNNTCAASKHVRHCFLLLSSYLRANITKCKINNVLMT